MIAPWHPPVAEQMSREFSALPCCPQSACFPRAEKNRARASSATFVSTYRCHRALRKEYATLWVPYVCVVLTQLQHHGVNSCQAA